MPNQQQGVSMSQAALGEASPSSVAATAGRWEVSRDRIVLVIALAGQLARGTTVPASSGTLPTHTPLFISLLIGVIVLVSGLTFFPALALGPIAEALS